MKNGNLMFGATLLMAAAGALKGGGSSAEEALAQDLETALDDDSPAAYHNDIVKALLNGMSDDQIRKAIRAGQEKLVNNIAAERAKDQGGPVTEELLAEVRADMTTFVEDELSGDKLEASFQAFFEGIDDDGDEGEDDAG